MGLIVEHRRNITAHLTQARLLDNHKGHTGRCDIFLGTAVDNVELRHIDRATQDIRTHIGHQRHITLLLIDLLQFALRDLGTEDGIVGRDMEVVCILRDLIVVSDRVGALCHLYHLAEALGLFYSLLAPYAGVQISGFLFQHVVRHHAELQAGTASQEQYTVALRHTQQLLHQGLCLIHYRLEILGTVADLKNRQPLTLKIQYGLSRLLNHLLRQDTRSRVKIVFFHMVYNI